LLEHISVVHEFGSSGQLQGAMHEPVSKVQFEKHFKVPVYPVPKTPEQVAPPKAVPSHFSVPSLIPFPQTAAQLLSLIELHPLPAGQHPSLLMQEIIVVCAHAPPEQLSVVQGLLSLHWDCRVHEMQLDIGEETHLLLEQIFSVQPLLSSH
jgi:hypothetical protein